MHRLYKKPAILVFAIITSFAFIFATTKHETSHAATVTAAAPVNNAAANTAAGEESEAAAIYNEMNLGSIGLKQDVFSTAMRGFKKLVSKGTVANDNMITIADFSQPSTQKRLYVLDLRTKKVLFNTLVAHGKNTGTLMANTKR